MSSFRVRCALASLSSGPDWRLTICFRSDLQPTCCDRSVEIIRQWSFKMLPFASARVTKTELPCVQHLAGKILSEARRVDFVTQHRIAKMMQMHPNLMCAATVQCAFNQTGLLARTKNAIFSFGRATAWLNSRSFFADAPDVVRFCSRLRPSLSAIFRRPGRGKSFPLCAR